MSKKWLFALSAALVVGVGLWFGRSDLLRSFLFSAQPSVNAAVAKGVGGVDQTKPKAGGRLIADVASKLGAKGKTAGSSVCRTEDMSAQVAKTEDRAASVRSAANGSTHRNPSGGSSSGTDAEWPQPGQTQPAGRIIGYRTTELPPLEKGGQPGELREWLTEPDEGYASHIEEEVRVDENGVPVVVAASQYVANQVLLTIDGETSFENFRRDLEAKGAIVKAPLMTLEKNARIVAVMHPQVGFDSVSELQEVLAQYNASLVPEKDMIRQASRTPSDTRYSSLWGMTKIAAPSAWDSRTGATSILVAVLDTGVDYNHEDLAANMWVNPSQGGYRPSGSSSAVTGDRYGARCIGGTWSGDPLDDNGHGTHCAGTIGAIGNNGKGVAGVAWSAKIMALKFLNSNGSGSDSDAIGLMDYARAKGVKVLSCSFGGTGYNSSVYSAIGALRSAGMLVVAAAGNSSSNNDSTPHYPSSYNLDNIIAVAATDGGDSLCSFSCYGATSVDIAAPGYNILSTYSTTGSTTGYAALNGTSMATPHVSGAAALVWAHHTSETYAQIRSRILTYGDSISAMSGKSTTGKRLNVYRALISSAPITAPVPSATRNLSDRVRVTWAAASGASYYRLYRATSSSGTKTALTGWTTSRTYDDTSVSRGTTYYYWVLAAATSSGGSASSFGDYATGWLPLAADSWDPGDNTASGGTLITPSATVQTHGQHTLSANDLYDFFRVSMTAGRTYTFESTGSYDMYGELFSSTSTNSSYRVSYNDDGGDSLNFKITYTPTVSQTYYLRVRRFSVGSEGAYYLRYSVTSSSDSWDPTDDTASGGTWLTPSTTVQTHGQHTLSSSDRYDFFRISMTAGTTYQFESTGSYDMYGELFSSTSTNSSYRVAYNDDGGSGANFLLRYTPTTSQTYYFRVRRYSVGSEGSYYLQYKKLPASTYDCVFSKISQWPADMFVSTNISLGAATTFYVGDPIYVAHSWKDSEGRAITVPVTNLTRIVNSSGAVVGQVQGWWGSGLQAGYVGVSNPIFTGLPAGSYTAYVRLNENAAGVHGIEETSYTNNVKSVAFTVIERKTLRSIAISGNGTVADKGTQQYTCLGTFSDGSTQTLSPTWSIVSGAAYASVNSSGLVTGNNSSTSSRTATLQAVYGGKTATKTLTILVGEIPDPFGSPVLYPSVPATVVVKGYIDGVLASAGDYIGVYAGTELRGSGIVDENGVAIIVAYASRNNETMTFKIWDASEGTNGTMVDCLGNETYSISPSGTLGTRTSPRRVDFSKDDPFGTPAVTPTTPTVLNAQVTIDDEAAATGDILGIFAGDTLVGKGVLTFTDNRSGAPGSVTGTGVATCTVVMYFTGTKTLTFRVWDTSAQEIYTCRTTRSLTAGSVLGSATATPYLIEFSSVNDDNTPCAVTLSTGWNLVSFSVVPSTPTPANIFNPVRSKISYVTSNKGIWVPVATSGNTLNAIELGEAYWVRATQNNVSWTVEGEGNSDKTISIQAGWNMIGYTLPRAGDVADVIETALGTGKIEMIVSSSKYYIPGFANNTLTAMRPGVGYWLKASSAFTLKYDRDGMYSGDAYGAFLSGLSGDDYAPFADPRPNQGTTAPTILANVNVTLFGKPAAYGDKIAVYGRRDGKIYAVQTIESEDGTVTIPLLIDDAQPMRFEIWNSASGLGDGRQIYSAPQSCDVDITSLSDVYTGVAVTIGGTTPTYTVTYDLDGKADRTGGGALSQTIAFGGNAVDPTIVAHTGYRFVDWDVGKRTDVRGNLTIKALYERLSTQAYVIRFAKNDGTAAAVSRTFNHGVNTKLPTLASLGWTRTGYRFRGWATSVARAKAGTIWKTDGSVVASPTPAGTTMNAVAVWEPIGQKYFVRFIKNDGAGTLDTWKFAYGVNTKLPTLSALGWVRNGMTFNGWATSAARAVQKTIWKTDGANVASPTAAGTTMDAIAVWTLKSGYYRIKFNKNDGTGKWRDAAYKYGIRTTLPSCGVGLGWTRNGYTFKGWSLTASGTTAWKPDRGVIVTGVPVGKTFNLYAIWQKNASANISLVSLVAGDLASGSGDPESSLGGRYLSGMVDGFELGTFELLVDDDGATGYVRLVLDGEVVSGECAIMQIAEKRIIIALGEAHYLLFIER